MLVILLGLFSFSFDFPLFGQVQQLAILPLGVGLFYLLTLHKAKTRENYKVFAWLGFAVNYVLFIAGIITLLVTNWLFPKDELSTYIKSLDEVTIFNSHISQTEPIKLADNALELLLEHSTKATFESGQWYTEQQMFTEPYETEKFPYFLHNVSTPAGMNVEVHFYIEKDGKGLLVQTPERHYYYRVFEPLIEKDGDK